MMQKVYPPGPALPEFDCGTVLSVERSPCNLENIKKALDEGLNPNIKWSQQDMEEHPQSGPYVVQAYRRSDEPCWANVNTPLHKSLHGGHFDAAMLLLNHGADVNQMNALGRTPLHETLYTDEWTSVGLRRVNFLLHHGANVDSRTEARIVDIDIANKETQIAGVTPLHQLIRNCNVEVARLLISAGARLDLLAPGGWSMLDLALLESNESIMSLMIQHGAQISRQRHDCVPPKSLNRRLAAQRLMAHTAIFPPFDLRVLYLSIIEHPEFLKYWNGAIASPNDHSCREVIYTFDALLSREAKMVDPHDISNTHLCSQCTRYLESPSPNGAFSLHPDRNSLSQSAGNGCRLCGVIEDALTHKSSNYAGIGTVEFNPESSKVVIQTSFGTAVHRSCTIGVSCGEESAFLKVVDLPDTFLVSDNMYRKSLEHGTGSPLALSAARCWLSYCQMHHKICKEVAQTQYDLPTRLIDVGNEMVDPFICLGKGISASYLALSYCWGSSRNVITTKATLPDYMKAICFDTLPATLRDAVVATRALGFQYLWIDSLCIIQDDKEDWQREAAQMVSVYSNATLTLSALDSNGCTEGMFRPRSDFVTAPVRIPMRLLKTDRQKLRWDDTSCTWEDSGNLKPLYKFVLPVAGGNHHLEPGPVTSRAWTLQEQLLSTRVLHFGPSMLFWDCLCGNGSEADPECSTFNGAGRGSSFYKAWDQKHVILGRFDPSHPDHFGSYTDRSTKAFACWQQLVEEYSSRNLTDPTDKIPAFLGISTRMARELKDEFMAGIWKGRFFLRSLLWTVKNSAEAHRTSHYPSWTWASIRGIVEYQSWSNLFECVPTEFSQDIQYSGASQNIVRGSISIRTSVKRFRRTFAYWCKDDIFEHGHVGRNLENLPVESMVSGGFRDVDNTATQHDPLTHLDDWLYFVVIAKLHNTDGPVKIVTCRTA